MRKLKIAGLVVSTALVTLLAGCGTNSSTSVVATYNGGTVTTAELDKQMNLEQLFNPSLNASPTIKQQVVKQYIVFERLLLPKAKQSGIKIPQTQVQSSLLSLKQQVIAQVYKGSTTNFDAKMQALKLTDADLAKIVEEELVVQAYAKTLIKTVPLSSQQQYYKQNLAQFTTVTERAILVKTLAQAQKVRQLLVNGASWNTIAKQYSQDPGSKNNGGEYVNQTPSNWVLPFQQHAMTQPLNVIGQPFNSQYGYFVMMVEKRTTVPFKSVQPSIVQQLQQQQGNQAFTALTNQVQSKANIKVTLPTS